MYCIMMCIQSDAWEVIDVQQIIILYSLLSCLSLSLLCNMFFQNSFRESTSLLLEKLHSESSDKKLVFAESMNAAIKISFFNTCNSSDTAVVSVLAQCVCMKKRKVIVKASARLQSKQQQLLSGVKSKRK